MFLTTQNNLLTLCSFVIQTASSVINTLGDKEMFAVGQKIFAKQNWTVTGVYDVSTSIERYEEYTVVGARGSHAILIRVIRKDGAVGPWRLMHNKKTMKVDVYTN